MSNISKHMIEVACDILSACASRGDDWSLNIMSAADALGATADERRFAKHVHDCAWYGALTFEQAAAEGEALLRDGWLPGDDVTLLLTPAQDAEARAAESEEADDRVVREIENADAPLEHTGTSGSGYTADEDIDPDPLDVAELLEDDDDDEDCEPLAEPEAGELDFEVQP